MSATYVANVSIQGTLTVLSSNVQANVLSGNISTTFNSFITATAVACGFNHMAILLNNGTVQTVGRNFFGQLGVNDTIDRSTVVPVLFISSQAIAIACGTFHTAILLNNGTVRTVGLNSDGQLGVNDVVTRSTVVTVLNISSQAIAIACGRYHTAILLNNGTVRTIGRNNFGQLGVNDVVTRSTVVTVLNISSQAIAVACGAYHTAILLNDGTVRTVGLNSPGQLGVNNTIDRSTVVSVLNVSTAIAVACGSTHTAILLNNGTVRTVGRNQFGQLGVNDVVTRSTVVSVLGISSQAIAIACGEHHTAILLNNGTVRTVGRNQFGQLGVNDTNNRSTVVSVLNISSQAIAVACGFAYGAILLNNGTVQMVGLNSEGQLGVNDVVTRSTVVPVVNLNIPRTTISLTSNVLIAPALSLGVSNPLFQLDLSLDTARKLTTTTWTTGSDEALKTNIEIADLDRCVDIVSKLDLKYFKWEIPSDDSHSLGWIAQEVEQFFPNAVRVSEAHGIPDFKNLDSDQIIKVMWGALKKLRADLKAKRLSGN